MERRRINLYRWITGILGTVTAIYPIIIFAIYINAGILLLNPIFPAIFCAGTIGVALAFRKDVWKN